MAQESQHVRTTPPEDNLPAPLRLRAEGPEDIDVLSTHLQDAILPLSEFAWLPEERRLVMVVNRFMWELAPGDGAPEVTDITGPAPYRRTNCGVRFRDIEGVQTRKLDLAGDRSGMLELLALRPDPAGLILLFAGGPAIRMQCKGINVILEDLGEPWPTSRRPDHPRAEGHGISSGAGT